MKPLLCLILLGFGGSSIAQEFKIDRHLIDRCLGINDETPARCVGVQTQVCAARNTGGPNIAVVACMETELAFWDAFLNRAYVDVQRLARDEQSMDVGFAPNQIRNVVRDMQWCWILYRDAMCNHDLARATSFGSAAGPAGSTCIMRETTRQVFQLTDIAGRYRQ